ncbi:initiator tRNA phosphoribosyl transferase [Heliocybe sulcata]|uniref:Initiator tRNA phosphoribosyl transferase n=1 Tax=Heliocybe sulcata TaxID=5364 RepID=A0A5C3N1D7_9AGAM|nr:initiator tRNA phosphoribosyl transferase [Heliocybe sulcata]
MSEGDGAFDARNEQVQALNLLRKESLDMFNRLHSISEDVNFVEEVYQAYPDIPILPNLRCGAWYTDPKIAAKEPGYFKSTDGHYGNWSFNLRRPNLHLLPLAVSCHGMIIVDSTRAGKRMPDALSKTVPIWCAVINRAVLRLREEELDGKPWDTRLYTPPVAVSAQEHRQIEERLDEWARSLAESSYILPCLPQPLRPLWITPATSVFPPLPPKDERSFISIVCVSASKQIASGMERRQGGFAYVQGSGDDHELWGKGLTPEIFWENRETLLESSRSEIPSMVEKLVEGNRQRAARHANAKWTALPTPIARVAGVLLLCKTADLPDTLPESLPPDSGGGRVAYVIVHHKGNVKTAISPGDVDENAVDAYSNVLRLSTPEGKKGQMHFLEVILPQSMSFVCSQFANERRICFVCDDGRDVSVGIALAALQKFFDDSGRLTLSEEGNPVIRADKETIRTRLQWIITSYPLANPSRTTLKRVNEFLLTPSSFRSKASIA